MRVPAISIAFAGSSLCGRWWVLLVCVGCAGFLLGGCAPEIGDACETALDCPTPSQAICDLSVPDGYCLLPFCEVNADCPEEAVCVRFDRFETYCMLGCSGDSDCRDGQVCRQDVSGSDSFCYAPLPSGEAPYTRPDTSSPNTSPDTTP